ncbi:MAG: ATP-binding protein [Polyangiaceae bacterium]|nr:ATP-binding protein [Polyangiaceae bacterium]
MPPEVPREDLIAKIRSDARSHAVVALIGPRQSGKSTLAGQFLRSARGGVLSFDLENPLDLARLEQPLLALESHRGWVVLDEVQRRPDLFPVLRVLADRKRQRFLVLGSASRDLLRQSSETLAGRIVYREVMPFSSREVRDHDRLWLRGGYPRSYLARSSADSLGWRRAYIATYLERDLPSLGIDVPAALLRRFWMMLTHYHGQIFNASEIARSLQISDKTARRYLDILGDTFMLRLLQPWYENIGKRQIKSPKVYFRDSGLLHALLDLDTRSALERHPKLGASWEGFALEEIQRIGGYASEECFFWGIHGEAELDLLVHRGGRRIGYEVKYSDHPRLTPSMKKALELLKLHHLYVVVPRVDEPFRLDPSVTVTSLAHLDTPGRKAPR